LLRRFDLSFVIRHLITISVQSDGFPQCFEHRHFRFTKNLYDSPNRIDPRAKLSEKNANFNSKNPPGPLL
jgi:hypothetical protein